MYKSTVEEQTHCSLTNELDVSQHLFFGQVVLLTLLFCEWAIFLVKRCTGTDKTGYVISWQQLSPFIKIRLLTTFWKSQEKMLNLWFPHTNLSDQSIHWPLTWSSDFNYHPLKFSSVQFSSIQFHKSLLSPGRNSSVGSEIITKYNRTTYTTSIVLRYNPKIMYINDARRALTCTVKKFFFKKS